MRSIQEILECGKRCRVGEMPIEIADLCYKIRNEQSLTKEEEELKNAWFRKKY